tara:strand:+ start:332 stop:628 length:297 start_codon:yes stop_codon:yes gene_type:complete
MALEDIGSSGLNELVNRIKKRFPEHNFDIPPPPDTRCKQTFDCKKLGNITYSDTEGNIYCGRRYKHSEDNALHTWEYKGCHALLKPAQIKDTNKELPF